MLFTDLHPKNSAISLFVRGSVQYFNKTQKEIAILLGITERRYQEYEYGNVNPVATIINKTG